MPAWILSVLKWLAITFGPLIAEEVKDLWQDKIEKKQEEQDYKTERAKAQRAYDESLKTGVGQDEAFKKLVANSRRHS